MADLDEVAATHHVRHDVVDGVAAAASPTGDHVERGAVDALFEAMRALARERGWPAIRWTTADDNYRARAVYDQLATRTTWLTYDMTVEA